MSQIHATLQHLASYVETNLTLDKVNEILNAKDPVTTIKDLVGVKTARIQVNTILLDLCTECSRARVSDALPSELDSWEKLSNNIDPKQMLGYLSILIELGKINPNDPIDLQMSLRSSRAYLLLMTVPGAKLVGAFDANLVKRTLRIMPTLILPTLRENDYYNMIQFVSLLGDVQVLLRYVSFDEEENLKMEVVYCVTLCMLCYHESSSRNHDSSSRGKYLLQIYDSCFGVLENLCLPVQGDVGDSLLCILKGTFRLNKFMVRPQPNRLSSSNTPKFPSINCWFIEMLKQYPVQTAEVMQKFVRCTLLDCKATEQDRINDINICVRYDSALFQAGNTFLLDKYLEKLATSTEAQQRLNIVDFVSKVLQVDNESDCTALSPVAREITFIKMLLLKTIDQNNRVKLRATNALLNLLKDGNKKSVCIIKFLFSNSIETAREHISSTAHTTESTSCTEVTESDAQLDEPPETAPTRHPLAGTEELWPHKENFLRSCNQNLVNASANVRKIGLLAMIFISSTSSNGIDNFLISKEFQMLYLDSSPMIRRQLVITMSTILDKNKSNDNIVDAYVRVCLNLAKDDDSKVVDAITESLKQNLFDNIAPYSETSSDKHIFPWRILSSILCSSERQKLRSCLRSSLGKNFITPEILHNIETHIDTTNSSEAWNLLCMVAPKISSKTPETVVTELIKQFKMTQKSHYAEYDNLKDNSYEQMEVLLSWTDNLERSMKKDFLKITTDLLMEGCVSHQNVQRIYELCYRICKHINESQLHDWVTNLRRHSEEYILKHIKTIGIPELYNNQLIGYMHTYVETVSDSNACNPEFVDALLEYLKVLEEHQFNDARAKVNAVQIVLTKLSLFDYETCLKAVTSICNLLKKSSSSSIISNALICLIDLCKKHTSQLEVVLPFILSKMRHEHHKIRMQALKGVSCLLLEDFLKFRGPVLIYVLAALSDDCAEIRTLAREVMVKFIVERNTVLLKSCLLEGPFVMNEYMYHDGLQIYGKTDSTLSSPLLGESHRKQREYCYRFFINNMETIQCYMYFENAHMLLDKVSNDKLIRTPQGLSAVSDMLYILAQICRMKEQNKKKAAVVSAGDDSDVDVVANTEIVVAGTSKGGSRNKGPTIEQALIVVEKVIPNIFTLDAKLRDIDASFFGDYMDELCSAICEHFPALTDLAQPETFWRKYRTANTTGKQKAKSVLRRRRGGNDADELLSEDDEDFVRSKPSSSNKTSPKLSTNEQKSKSVMRRRRGGNNTDELSSEDEANCVRSKSSSSKKFSTNEHSPQNEMCKPAKSQNSLSDFDDSDSDEVTTVKLPRKRKIIEN